MNTHCTRPSESSKPTSRKAAALLRAEGMKWCGTCSTLRPLADFNAASDKSDGLCPNCRYCKMEKSRKRRASAAPGEWRGCPCHYCGKTMTPQNHSIDHVIPTAKGGTDTPSNLVHCCIQCNTSKGSLDIEEFRTLRERQRDLVPRFSPRQIKYLRQCGFEFPVGAPYLFWFERDDNGRLAK